MAARSFIPDFQWTTNWIYPDRLDFWELLKTASLRAPQRVKACWIGAWHRSALLLFGGIFVQRSRWSPCRASGSLWLPANVSSCTISHRASLSTSCVLRSIQQQSSCSSHSLTTSTFSITVGNALSLHLTVVVPQVCRARYSHVCLALWSFEPSASLAAVAKDRLWTIFSQQVSYKYPDKFRQSGASADNLKLSCCGVSACSSPCWRPGNVYLASALSSE